MKKEWKKRKKRMKSWQQINDKKKRKKILKKKIGSLGLFIMTHYAKITINLQTTHKGYTQPTNLLSHTQVMCQSIVGKWMIQMIRGTHKTKTKKKTHKKKKEWQKNDKVSLGWHQVCFCVLFFFFCLCVFCHPRFFCPKPGISICLRKMGSFVFFCQTISLCCLWKTMSLCVLGRLNKSLFLVFSFLQQKNPIFFAQIRKNIVCFTQIRNNIGRRRW